MEESKDDYAFRLKMEEFVVSTLEKEWNCKFASTEKDANKRASYSPVDGFLIKDGKIMAMVENRSRKEHLSDVKRWGGILINYDKLGKAIQLSQLLRVPFYFIGYFFNDGILAYWKITDENGDFCLQMTLKNDSYQKSLKEGTDVKMNRNVAILSNDGIKIIKTELFF